MRSNVVVEDLHTSRNWRGTAVLRSIIRSNVICDLVNQKYFKELRVGPPLRKRMLSTTPRCKFRSLDVSLRLVASKAGQHTP
jgi:hypothetical protein